jgi:hypothetical protein
MPRRLPALLVMTLALTAPCALVAQDQPSAVWPGLTLQPRPKAAPHAFVFRVPTPTPTTKAPDTTKPVVVCGMLVVPAEPTFDAAIRRNPTSSNTKFTLQIVQPTICTRDRR